MGNGMVHEAFQYQRQRRNTSNASEMMQYFYDRAEKLGKLDCVLQMSLMLVEERELVDFLQRSDRPSSQEVLLMYYLQVRVYCCTWSHLSYLSQSVLLNEGVVFCHNLIDSLAEVAILRGRGAERAAGLPAGGEEQQQRQHEEGHHGAILKGKPVPGRKRDEN